MAAIVGIHGIAQQLGGPNTLRSLWLPALRDGVGLSGNDVFIGEEDIEIAFWGDLFRQQRLMGVGAPALDASDVEEGWETRLVLALWEESARGDTRLPSLGLPAMGVGTTLVQHALTAMAGSKFFSRLGEAYLILWMKQVRAYLTDAPTRNEVRERARVKIGPDTRVVIGHSLGSVVAYEVLCKPSSDWRVHTLITLGSPLGIPNLVFDRLEPAPADGKGTFPAGVRRWVNIAAPDDIIALRKALAPLFEGDVIDHLVENGAESHAAEHYLTAAVTGAAIATAVSTH